jgi:5-methyltetrahydropteroyltriglutamate--homocysteine methyltransferase
VIEMLLAHRRGQPFTPAEAAVLERAVAEGVRTQAECGIDVVSDGEFGKSGFSQYADDRLAGFENRPDLPGRGGATLRSRDRRRFPEAYRVIESAPDSTGGRGGEAVNTAHVVCTAPIT